MTEELVTATDSSPSKLQTTLVEAATQIAVSVVASYITMALTKKLMNRMHKTETVVIDEPVIEA